MHDRQGATRAYKSPPLTRLSFSRRSKRLEGDHDHEPLAQDDMTQLQYSPSHVRRLSFLLTYAIVLLSLTGLSCQTAYYETMEKFGYHKRDLWSAM